MIEPPSRRSSGNPEQAARDGRQRAGISALVSIATPADAVPDLILEVPEPKHSRRRYSQDRPGSGAEPVQVGRRLLAALPLAAVLLVQAVLAVRLIWSNTAFQDEALYLWAGHLEIAHWLHGTPIPPFATYFSGAPVLYPPVGAVADSIGGLAAARLLSLACMLGATSLLWSTTARLYGRRAAFFAAALFALLGPTLHVSAFATFDAPAMLLVALSVWCVVRADGGEATGWMLASASALALANATAYSSAIFDPVVVVIAILTGARVPGGKQLARRAAALGVYLVVLVVILAEIGGGYYWTGIGQTVLMRSAGDNAPLLVLRDAAGWTLAIAVPAVVGGLIALARRQRTGLRLLPAVLAACVFLVPVEQARIHTITSLDKHADVGAWFAAIAAGYALDACIGWIRPRFPRRALTVAALAALVGPAELGAAQAAQLYSWPNAAGFVTAFGPLAGPAGRLLVEDPSIGEYYLPSGHQWQRWSNTRSIILPSGRGTSGSVGNAGNADAYAKYIAAGYFSAVALNFEATPGLDRQIAADLSKNPAYHVVAELPYGAGTYVVWQYKHDGGGK